MIYIATDSILNGIELWLIGGLILEVDDLCHEILIAYTNAH